MVILLLALHPFTHVMEFTFFKYHKENAKHAYLCLEDMKQKDSLNSHQHKYDHSELYMVS